MQPSQLGKQQVVDVLVQPRTSFLSREGGMDHGGGVIPFHSHTMTLPTSHLVFFPTSHPLNTEPHHIV